MKDRINLDYEHSPDPYDRHRALYMYWPTTEMTGDYTCKVSTLQNDVTGTKRMTVFGMYSIHYLLPNIYQTSLWALKFIFYKKGAKFSWLQDFLQILSPKIEAPA